MDNLKAIIDQGIEARNFNGDNSDADGNPKNGARLFTQFDCPYGPGDNRDAWLKGFGGEGQAEVVAQVDASTPNNEDVRSETAETVKDVKKPDDSTPRVSTDLTGTGETSLETHVTLNDPASGDIVPSPDVKLGDPSASTAPTDAKVSKPDSDDSAAAPAKSGKK